MPVDTAALTPSVGVEFTRVTSVATLFDDVVIARLLEALKWRGVVIIRGLHLDDESQLAFTRMLGDVAAPEGSEIFKVTFDPAQSANAQYLKANRNWHIDGYTPDIPAKTSILTARRIGSGDAGTEFTNTYAAWEALPIHERKRYEGLRVMHTFKATQRGVIAEPTEQQLTAWRTMPSHESWLVWKRRDGRTSLVLSASADHIVGMGAERSRAILDELLAWTTQRRFCYAHHWQVGDVVVLDNTGMLHRALPYDASSERTLHRTAIKGDEAWC